MLKFMQCCFIIVMMIWATVSNAAIWQAPDGSLHDDSNGLALMLPNWPKNAIMLTDAQVASVLAAQQAALPPVINSQGFIAAVKSVFGGPVAILSLPPTVQNAITLCIAAINEGNWADVQAIIISQQAALNAANIAIYPAIKAAATANNIPITL